MKPRLPVPFGVPWEALDSAALLAFLSLNEQESLTWEAKGGVIKPVQVREAASAFGNSAWGGYLVLGASWNKAAAVWIVDGWVPPETEVDLWVSKVLGNGGVNPLPSVEVKAWPLDAQRVIAVVAIWPVSTPPVITSSGQVFERTSGASPTVKDPVDLRRLFERGEAARIRARQRSIEGMNELFAIEQTLGQPGCVLGFAAVSLPSEMSAEVFRQSRLGWFAEAVKELHRRYVAADFQRFIRYEPEWNQAGITFRTNDGFRDTSESYSLRVGRDGRVAVGFRDPDVQPTSNPENYAERLRLMWETGRGALDELGAIGEVHAALEINTTIGGIEANSWSDMMSDGRQELSVMVRDLQRALGQSAWEPEPPDDDSGT